MLWQVIWFYFLAASLCLTNSHVFPVPCEALQSTTVIIVNLTSTAMGSTATYQCRDGSSDVYTTQCTSDGVWEPNPNSTLDCTGTDHDVPMQNGVIVAVIILVIVTGITIVVVAVFYWRINESNKTSELQTQDCTTPGTVDNNMTACKHFGLMVIVEVIMTATVLHIVTLV